MSLFSQVLVTTSLGPKKGQESGCATSLNRK
jgi:hypothetical protein